MLKRNLVALNIEINTWYVEMYTDQLFECTEWFRNIHTKCYVLGLFVNNIQNHPNDAL